MHLMQDMHMDLVYSTKTQVLQMEFAYSHA